MGIILPQSWVLLGVALTCLLARFSVIRYQECWSCYNWWRSTFSRTWSTAYIVWLYQIILMNIHCKSHKLLMHIIKWNLLTSLPLVSYLPCTWLVSAHSPQQSIVCLFGECSAYLLPDPTKNLLQILALKMTAVLPFSTDCSISTLDWIWSFSAIWHLMMFYVS